jgi:hypothetical protein
MRRRARLESLKSLMTITKVIYDAERAAQNLATPEFASPISNF